MESLFQILQSADNPVVFCLLIGVIVFQFLSDRVESLKSLFGAPGNWWRNRKLNKIKTVTLEVLAETESDDAVYAALERKVDLLAQAMKDCEDRGLEFRKGMAAVREDLAQKDRYILRLLRWAHQVQITAVQEHGWDISPPPTAEGV